MNESISVKQRWKVKSKKKKRETRLWKNDCLGVAEGTEINLIDQQKGELLLEVEERTHRFED